MACRGLPPCKKKEKKESKVGKKFLRQRSISEASQNALGILPLQRLPFCVYGSVAKPNDNLASAVKSHSTKTAARIYCKSCMFFFMFLFLLCLFCLLFFILNNKYSEDQMTYRNIIFFITDRQFGRKALFMNIYVYEHKKN